MPNSRIYQLNTFGSAATSNKSVQLPMTEYKRRLTFEHDLFLGQLFHDLRNDICPPVRDVFSYAFTFNHETLNSSIKEFFTQVDQLSWVTCANSLKLTSRGVCYSPVRHGFFIAYAQGFQKGEYVPPPAPNWIPSSGFGFRPYDCTFSTSRSQSSSGIDRKPADNSTTSNLHRLS